MTISNFDMWNIQSFIYVNLFHAGLADMQLILKWFSNRCMVEENHLLEIPKIMKSFPLYGVILSIFVFSLLRVLSSENVPV